MIHDLLFHILLLLGILGLSASLIWVWQRRHAATSHATTRATRRSLANQPFPGLIHKPSCVTCEDGA
jgi:cyanate permease